MTGLQRDIANDVAGREGPSGALDMDDLLRENGAEEDLPMAFTAQIAKPFTRAGIDQIPDTVGGVYGLFRQGVWVYVGKGFVRGRLLSHLNGDDACITRQAPTHFVVETLVLDIDGREKELIGELSPVCNERVG